MKLSMKTISTAMSAILLSITSSAFAADEITVAYFQEWPMPFQYAKVNGTYEKELGVSVNWVAFDTGTAMSAAMASGDVHISVSQGVPPFVVAASAGQDIQIVDVAVSYADNDNCVVATALEIDASNTDELKGLKVAVPMGTAAHYGFLKQMEHFKVDVSSMSVVDMAPAEGAAALAQGSLDMACGWGGALGRMKQHGNVLMTGAQKEELGIQVFDVTTVPANFADEEPELLAKFLKVTADANAMWNSGNHSSKMLPVIAKDAGMDEKDAAASLATFVFPSISEQLSQKWLGGGSQDFLKAVADFFVKSGNIPKARSSYESAVVTSGLKSAAKM